MLKTLPSFQHPHSSNNNNYTFELNKSIKYQSELREGYRPIRYISIVKLNNNERQLLTDNPELLHYSAGKLHITILGGIKFTGLDMLKVTLKIIQTDRKQLTFRHNVDIYNHIQTGQLIERVAETLDVTTSNVSDAISQLTTAI